MKRSEEHTSELQSRGHLVSSTPFPYTTLFRSYYHYGIDKYTLPKKCFGVYPHYLTDPTLRLTRGFNDQFLAPHSRYTSVSMEEIEKDSRLKIISYSDEEIGRAHV